MADDNNQNPQPASGNDPAARTETGELKDQTNLIPQSGLENPTNSGQSEDPNASRSFLNRSKQEPAPDPKAQSTEDKGTGDEKPASTGAPEKYEDFKLPDGYTFDPEALKNVSAMFRKAGLSQEMAQEMVDYYAENSLQASQEPYKLWADTQKEWVGEIDNRFGSKAESMRTDINKGIDAAITSPKLRTAFREALDFTGAGSNPDFFEALSIMLKPFIESGSVKGNGPSAGGQQRPETPTRPTAAEAIYPHLIPNRQQ